MSKYTCPKEGCNYIKELFYYDGAGIRDILAHEEEHRKNTKEVIHKEKEDCDRCDGKGYIEYTYTIDEDVSEPDSGRD